MSTPCTTPAAPRAGAGRIHFSWGGQPDLSLMCPVPFSGSSGKNWQSLPRSRSLPAWPPPTCSACSSARWQSATANDSVLFCCTPAFTDSRLFMLNNIWACCSAMVLVRGQTGTPSIKGPRLPSPISRASLEWGRKLSKWREVKPHGKFIFVGTAASQESGKAPRIVQPQGKCSGYGTTGSSERQAPSSPLPMVTVYSFVFMGKFRPNAILVPAAPASV